MIQNPDFQVDPQMLRAALDRMRADPKPLERPVLVLGGWRAPYISPWGLQARIRRAAAAPRDRFIAVAYPLLGSIDSASTKAVRALKSRGWLDREIDIVAFSMGGLVARALAAGLAGAPPGVVRPVRIFTLATPHRGAMLADHVRPDPAARQMQAGSGMLANLDAALAHRRYELHCYTLLGDWWVGATRAAPPGMEPMWLDPQAFLARQLSHFAANFDRRIIADIALRLRGEPALGRPGAPPPRD